MEDKELKHGKWETKVYVWNKQPTMEQAKTAGVGDRSEVVLKFKTNAGFGIDQGVSYELRKYARESVNGSINIFDIEEVGFRSGRW